MKLVSLTAGGRERVLAVVRLANGELVDVVFTVTNAFLSESDSKVISVANAEPDVFRCASMSAHEVHRIVEAVMAFTRVAAEPDTDPRGGGRRAVPTWRVTDDGQG